MWALIPVQLRVALLIGLGTLALIAGGIVYGKIYDRGYQAAALEAAKEKAKLQAANDKAILEARASMQRQVDQLLFDNSKVEQHVRELDSQADKDPAGDRRGLSSGSVRRLDAIH